MEIKGNPNTIYAPSDNVVVREIQGELIIIPITSGVGDLEGEIYTLNETGRAIWDKLDGKRNLGDVARDLSLDFDATNQEIEKDCLGLVGELLKRKMLVEAKRD